MKNTYTNEPSRSAALAAALNRPGIEILRYGLVIVLLWIGGMKFTRKMNPIKCMSRWRSKVGGPRGGNRVGRRGGSVANLGCEREQR